MEETQLEVNMPTRHIAAIDLGSNSFHLVVAKVIGGDIQIVSRHKQRVRLASGLDAQNNLDATSIQRGLDCLSLFAERLQGFELDDVRIAATHTLRIANNAHVFLTRAATILPFPIEIISGTEEARLIYSGVTHTQVEARNKLVVDIGGGSTEIIIGKELTPLLLNSKQMGCVSYTDSYFKQGKVTPKTIKAATIAVQQRLEGIRSKYLKLGWDVAICSSGTAKAIHEVLIAQGYEDGIITKKRLNDLLQIIQDFKCIDEIKIPKLSEERQPVFAAGVVILRSIMKELNISEMHYSSGALREGILYEMDDRFNRSDIRMRTTESLAVRHAVETEHAEQVKQTALELFEQAILVQPVKKKKELMQLLSWSALLHEVGLSIHYQGYHKHSSYLLRYSNMPGFNQEQQQLLSTLARFHRKSLKLLEIPSFYLYRESDVLLLIRVLRLAVLLNNHRDQKSQQVVLNIESNDWHLHFEQEVPNFDILAADIESENAFLQKRDWCLTSNLNVMVE